MADIALPDGGDNVEVEVASEGGKSSVSGVQTPYLPQNVLAGEKQEEFMTWIVGEILDVRDGSERKAKEADWIQYRKNRRAKKQSKTKDTPWVNSANVESTLTAQKVNAIYAKEVAAFAVKKPPMRVRAADMALRDQAESLERFMTYLAESRYGMNMPVNQNQIFYDQVSLGGAIVKVPFLVEQMSFKRTDATSGSQDVKYVRHRGPAVVPIRLEDFFTRPYWKDIQRAPWVAVRYRMYKHEIEQKQAIGFFDKEAMTAVSGTPITRYDDGREADLANANVSAGSLGRNANQDEFEIYEVNAFFDVDGDGYAEDVIAWIEPSTNTLLRSEFNPLSIRDYELVPYLEDPESLYPIGICELVADLQDEATALKQMRLDGTKLSMLKMFISRTGCGIDVNESFQPFKHFQMDDPVGDFREITFNDISQSCLAGEEMTKQEADRVTGANDYMTGFNDKTVGSGASVGGTMFLAQQGNSILNSILTRAEQSIGNIYMIALYQCMANKDKLDLSFMSSSDQLNMAKVLAYEVEDIPTQFRFTVAVTDISKTDEAKRQEGMVASQIYTMYGQTMMQLMQAMPQGQQMLPELTTKLFVGGTELAQRILELTGIQDARYFLPFTEHLAVQMEAADRARAEQTAVAKEQLNGQGQGQDQFSQNSVGSPIAGMAGASSGGISGNGQSPAQGNV